jgi:ubiquinone/menaquinone biosynthesis C-methylase UbiE
MSTDDHYTHGHHPSVLRSHTWRTAENSAAYLLPHLSPSDELLDVGCGPGTITTDFARRLVDGQATGVDSAADIVEAARQSAQGGGASNVKFEVANIYELPFDDESFDVVHAHQVLQHLARPVTALQEMARVCRPGGVVAARDGDYPAMAWFPANPGLDLWMDAFCRTTIANGGHPAAARELMSWAHQAGWDDVIPSASTWCFATESDRQWWGGLWAERVVESTFATRAVELEIARVSDLAEMAQGWNTWAEQPDGWFAMIHGEILWTKSR